MPIVAVVAIDESRAEPPQQESGERHSAHLMLDEICKTGWQRGRENDPVEVARVIRDDDARVVRLDGAAFDSHGAADREEVELSGASRQTSPAVQARNDREQDAERDDDGEQGHPSIGPVDGMEDASHGRKVLGLRRSAATPAFMSKLPSSRCDIRRGFAGDFCDTFLFMLMLPNFCEGGHAGGRTPHAYSTRCDMPRRVPRGVV